MTIYLCQYKYKFYKKKEKYCKEKYKKGCMENMKKIKKIK